LVALVLNGYGQASFGDISKISKKQCPTGSFARRARAAGKLEQRFLIPAALASSLDRTRKVALRGTVRHADEFPSVGIRYCRAFLPGNTKGTLDQTIGECSGQTDFRIAASACRVEAT